MSYQQEIVGSYFLLARSVHKLTSGKYFVGETIYLEGYSALNRETM